jgi:hypothetical protein
LIREAGLAVLRAVGARRLAAAPAGWQGRAEAVERELHRRFGQTPQLRASDEQSEQIGKLIASGQLSARLLVLRA